MPIVLRANKKALNVVFGFMDRRSRGIEEVLHAALTQLPLTKKTARAPRDAVAALPVFLFLLDDVPAARAPRYYRLLQGKVQGRGAAHSRRQMLCWGFRDGHNMPIVLRANKKALDAVFGFMDRRGRVGSGLGSCLSFLAARASVRSLRSSLCRP
ncbi:hypothetical protein NDU88_003930 [Pleurodeles waltl]|uniref:Uncharacterized protein n=1 Tax=Pleurodeles waltl TaxID=8319 RepID=A0AAV7UFR7_PLEWA|nr:hypothetical protein NDU88_003930 [Pleurodeles waltl]